MKAIKCFITYKSVAINDATASINPPLTIDEFKDIDVIRSQSEKISEQSLRDFGAKLFQRVFTNQALEQYKSTSPSALALVISGDLALIPWELLHDGTDWIARTRGIVRVSTTGRKSPDLFKKAGDLKILAAISGPIINETMPDDDPDQVSTIDVNAHADIFQKLEGESFPAQIKVRKHITKESLSWELSENHHVLHFVGHGGIGRLLFETRHASADLVEENWLQEQITIGLRGNLRLVVLNSCHSAEESEEVHGIANSILGTGVPALIAMQGSISELADLTFARTFYQALALGKSIDEAVMLSRHAMASDWEIGIHEWSTPVLFINDSLLSDDISLNIMDAEMLEMMEESKAKIVFPQRVEIPSMLTSEQKFVGRRRELSEVLLYLDPQRRDSVQVVCLQGEAGIGKTAIAIEAVHRMAEWFNEIVYLSGHNAPPKELREHIKGDDPLSRLDSPEGFLMALARKCGLDMTGDKTEAELRDAILKALSGNKWKLLVFDSVEELIKSDVIRSLLSNLPTNCKAIITSRERLEINERQIHVSSMNRLDSLRLLRSYGSLKGMQINVDELGEIVHFTGGHPMAMRLVISQVIAGDKTLANVLKDLKKAKGTIFDYVFSNSLKLALKDGRRLFAIMSLFYPTVSRKALQEISKLNDDTFDKALKRIVGLSLIESYGNGKRFGLHNLARLKSEQLSAEDQDKEKYQERMTEFFMEFLNATVPMTQPDTAVKAIESQMPEGMPREQIQGIAMELFVKPALGMMETELSNCLSSLEWEISKDNLDNAIWFLDNLGDFLVIRGYWNLTEHYAMRMSKTLGEQGKNELRAKIIFNLGTLNYRQGKWKDAIKAYETAIKFAHEFGNLNLEVKSLNGLGVIYLEQGNTDRAVECFENALNICQSIDDNIEKARLLNNLGIIYQRKNDCEKALNYFIDSRDIFIQQNDKLGEADTLIDIGACYQSIRKYEDAIRFYEDSLKIFCDLGSKAGQAILTYNIGGIYYELGKIDDALQYFNHWILHLRLVTQ
jgi:tetratricopeptide (TPR) repeat protein